MSDLKIGVRKVGQKYVDDPIYKVINTDSAVITKVRTSLSAAFGSLVPEPIRVLEGYERTRLRWMKPDGKGGLIPK